MIIDDFIPEEVEACNFRLAIGAITKDSNGEFVDWCYIYNDTLEILEWVRDCMMGNDNTAKTHTFIIQAIDDSGGIPDWEVANTKHKRA